METTPLSPLALLAVVGGYFAVLIAVGYFTAGRGDGEAFFKGGRSSPWYLVAWGMIGASLSGVTFVSIPGVVGAGGLNQQYAYMQVVLGYILGYVAIAGVLLPLYYRLGLTSIYGYLAQRFGESSYFTGAGFFQLSRVIGASFRLYLVAIVMDAFVLGPLGVPFWVTVAVTLALIYAYTFKGGIQTVVYTDTLQTTVMLLAVGIAVYSIVTRLGVGLGDIPALVSESGLDQTFFFGGGWSDPNNFFKQFLSGALITVVMTGLDQDMMQKNLTCRNLGDAQKNVMSLSILLVPINLLFLTLGILLYVYLQREGLIVPYANAITTAGDRAFPSVALLQIGPAAAVTFLLGLVAAAYSSADSALTSLTTSFCVDFLGFEREERSWAFAKTENETRRARSLVHVGFAVVLFLTILVFYALSDLSVINKLFTWAGYTYGPLLGMFAFGLTSKRAVWDRWVPVVCVASVLLTVLVNANSEAWFGGLELGFLVLAVNGAITYVGMWGLSVGRGGSSAAVISTE